MKDTVPGTNPTSFTNTQFGRFNTRGSNNPGTPKGATRHAGKATTGAQNYQQQMSASKKLNKAAEAQAAQSYNRTIPMRGRGR